MSEALKLFNTMEDAVQNKNANLKHTDNAVIAGYLRLNAALLAEILLELKKEK